MVRSAVACAEQVAALLGLAPKAGFGLKVAVDEAFCNAVEHFSGPVDQEERIHLEFSVQDGSLVVSLRERGIPFDLSRAERYTPDTPEGMNQPGLGMLLMHQGVDSVELFVHGREGKETRLTKKLAYGSIPPGLIPRKRPDRRKQRPTVRNADIRPATIPELAEVCRLAWRCYGFTQEAFLYDPDALTEKVRSGEFKSIVAVDPKSGNMVGHVGLKYHDPEVRVPELGLAFLDPGYRCPGLSNSMAKVAFALARDNGDAGVFDCSVTTHTFSQKAMQEYFGSRPCNLLMGIAASGLQARELATTQQEKGSVMSHYHAFDRTPATVYIPQRHQDMVREIHEWLELPRTFGETNGIPKSGHSDVLIIPLPEELNAAFIVVRSIGPETVAELTKASRECQRKRLDAVYAFLPASTPGCPAIADACEDLGFSFAGVMPHIHDHGDRLLMQRVDIPLDTGAIRVYGDMSRKLLDHVLNDAERVREHR